MPGETYLRYNVLFLKIIGAVEVKTVQKYLLRLWRCILSANMFYFILSSFLYYKTENVSDFQAIFITCFYIMTSLVIWLKLNYFYLFDGTSSKILKEINDLLKRETQSETLQETVDLTKKITCFWVGTCSAFALSVIVSSRILPLRLWYPYDWKVSPYYELTLVYQVFMTQMMPICFSSTYMFFVFCILLTNAQFKSLGWKLKSLVQSTLLNHGVRSFAEGENFPSRVSTVTDESVEELINSEDVKEDLLQELTKCAKFHQALLKICVLLEDFFSPIFLPLLLCTTISAVFMASSFTGNVDAAMKFISGAAFICMSVSLFWPCYFGQLLLTQTEELYGDLYGSHWYLCDETFKTNFKILYNGASKPVRLTFGKFADLSLDVFLKVIKAVVSYVIFLAQVSGSSQK